MGTVATPRRHKRHAHCVVGFQCQCGQRHLFSDAMLRRHFTRILLNCEGCGKLYAYMRALIMPHPDCVIYQRDLDELAA